MTSSSKRLPCWAGHIIELKLKSFIQVVGGRDKTRTNFSAICPALIPLYFFMDLLGDSSYAAKHCQQYKSVIRKYQRSISSSKFLSILCRSEDSPVKRAFLWTLADAVFALS